MKKKLDVSNAVIFVSEIRSPNFSISSTHIMTNNMLSGIKNNGKKVILFAIASFWEENEDIKNYYSQICDEVIVLPSFIGYPRNKYVRLIKLILCSRLGFKYKDTLNNFCECSGTPEKIISHSPSLESIYYARELKKKFLQTEYYSYWSDPVTLSGILPDNINIKRLPYKYLEKLLLKYGDRIIYGTKTLMDFQKKLFPLYEDRMTYIDVAYTPSDKSNEKSSEKYSDRLIYAGNYNKSIRNINPLVEAVGEIKEYALDIYGVGDIDFVPSNVNVCGKVHLEDLKKEEEKYSILTCILNKSCIQIPGKSFYSMNKDAKILVIADGKYKEEIIEYLNSYNRFFVCDNNKDSIKKAIYEIKNLSPNDYSDVIERYSPKKISADLLNGGLK